MSEIEEIQKKIKPVLSKYKVKNASIFGSYARNEQSKESDIDFLVTFENESVSLFDIFDFKNELSEILEKKVDVVTEKSLVSYFKPFIKKDALLIYEHGK